MERLAAIFDLFRKGSAVADPALWKKRQINTTVLIAIIYGIVRVGKAYGLDIHMDDQTAAGLAAGVIALVNLVLTYTTTDKIGVPGLQTQSQSDAVKYKDDAGDNKAGGG